MNTNGALGWTNALDAAHLAASSEASGLTIGNLQSPHLSTKWRSAGDLTVWWTADFGAVASIDAVGIFGANVTASATWRIRLSTTAAQDGDLYDSSQDGSLGAMMPFIFRDLRVADAPVLRSQALHLLPARVAARYLKIDLADAGLDYLEAGLAWAGPLFQPERNFNFGQAAALQDPSTTTPSVGGQEYTDLRPLRRTDSFTFGLLTEAEHRQVQAMDAATGTARNVLWLPKPGMADMSDTAILGRCTALTPGPSVAFNRRSRQFQIAERL